MLDPLHDLMHQIFEPLQRMLDSVGVGFPELSAILFILGVCTSIPWISIFRKAGYRPIKGYLMLIPIVNIFVFFSFAFGDWPLEREFRKLDPTAAWRDY